MERKIILFIAASMDGFIAGKDGDIDWLFMDNDYNYTPFYESIDTTLMGYKTFETILAMGGEFHYKDKTSYVFTRNTEGKQHEHVTFTSQDPAAFTKRLLAVPGKDIFLVGGGEINTIMLNAGLIDRIVYSIHPMVVGEGVKLFADGAQPTQFETKSTQQFESGLVQIIMERK